MKRARLALALCLLGAFFARTKAAHAETLQTAIGSKPVSLGEGRIACAAPGSGWTIDPTSQLHAVRPPDASDSVGTVVELKVAPTLAACSTGSSTVKLVATARPPSVDASSVVLQPDQGKVDVRGHRLTGVTLTWRSNTASGVDVCESPKIDGGVEHCSFDVPRGLPADPSSGSLSLIPAGGKAGTDISNYDADGKPVAPESFVLVPARVVLSSVVSADASIDLSTGRGEVELTHPDAVAGVDCGAQRCEIFHNALVVRSLSSNVSSVDVKFRLVPNVFLSKGSGVDATPTAHLSVVHCPMSAPSGPVLRGTGSARVVLRIEGRCANEVPSLRFLIGADSAEVLESLVDSTGTDVLVQVGSTDAQALTITAVHTDDPGVAVAVVRVETISPPQSSASLEIPGHKNLNFVPTNRPAIVHVPPLEHHAHLVPLPVPGVYSVQKSGADYLVIGDPDAAGLAALKFGYRNQELPGALADVDLGVLTSPLQRNIHEANLPAPIGGSALGPNPIVEFVCGRDNRTERVVPGVTAHLPYESRDNCRLIFHRDRLPVNYGTQKLNLEIDVVDSDGGSRAEGHVSETIVMRSGGDPIYAWIQGVKAPFDRVLVRISHAADEAHYVGGAEIQTGAPEVKWTLVLGTGRARLYATTAIPTGLYRFGHGAANSGVLSLNFGIVSRLTWLSADGHEGFLGLEGGIMAIGLTNDQSSTGNSLTQVGLVGGIGLSVPIANRSTPTQASINLHGWVEEDISHTSGNSSSRSAFIFGPSISIGNVGTNL